MRASWWPVTAALKALISLSRRSARPASASPTVIRTSLIIVLLPWDGRRRARGAAGDDPVAQRGVAHVAGRCRIALGPGNRLAGELLMPGHPLSVGVDGALGHDVKPGLELLLTARPDLDPRWHHPLGFTREGTAKHVFERFEPITPPGQQGADRGVGQMGELDLHGRPAVGEGLLDFIESGRIRHAAEAESRDLVVRRTLPGEARHTTRNRDHKARRACPAAGGLAALGDELNLYPFDAPGQGGIAEQRRPPGAH